jgi:hypothetical protein
MSARSRRAWKPRPTQVVTKPRSDPIRQQRYSVLLTLGIADQDMTSLEVDILHAQASALQQPQAGP